MNSKVLFGITLVLFIVVGISLGRGCAGNNLLDPFERIEKRDIGIVINEHIPYDIMQYHPIRENEMTIIELYEKIEKPNWPDRQVYHLMRWQSHPSLSVDMAEVMSAFDSTSLQLEDMDDIEISFHPGIETNPFVREDSYDEVIVQGEVRIALEDYLEWKLVRSETYRRAQSLIKKQIYDHLILFSDQI